MSRTPSFTRRDFVKSSAALGAASILAPSSLASGFHLGPRARDTIRVGLIGCGGRGTGAASDALAASPNVRIAALGDAFEHRLNSCRNELDKRGEERAIAPDDNCFVGIDAYQRVIDSDVDVVILTTPPHFRPMQFEAAVKAGKHVFMEKPVAVDPAGVRRVIAAAEVADQKNLSVVTGTQRRHEKVYHELIKRLHDGQIGTVTAGRVYWNQQGLWCYDREPGWTDLEYQLRNWYYFTWLSGDHIVEQHIHQHDVANWVMGGVPVKCLGLGGRQTRTATRFGHIYDHFAVEYEYSDGRFVQSFCRQQDGCDSRVSENFIGDKGHSWSSSGWAQIRGTNPWRFEGDNPNPYVQEHIALAASINGEIARLNEAKRCAESTLTAIMGRMSAYTGKEVTWEQALNSKLDLSPPSYDMNATLPIPPVAMPGTTPLI
jgi:predicted dehydrogenase